MPLVCSHILGVSCTNIHHDLTRESCHFRNIHIPTRSPKDRETIIELCFASRYTKAYLSYHVLLILFLLLFSHLHHSLFMQRSMAGLGWDTKTRGQALAYSLRFVIFSSPLLLLYCIAGLGLDLFSRFPKERVSWFFLKYHMSRV